MLQCCTGTTAQSFKYIWGQAKCIVQLHIAHQSCTCLNAHGCTMHILCTSMHLCNLVTAGTERNGDTPAFSSEKKLVKSANRLGAMAEVSTVLGWHSPIQYTSDRCIQCILSSKPSSQTSLLAGTVSGRC